MQLQEKMHWRQEEDMRRRKIHVTIPNMWDLQFIAWLVSLVLIFYIVISGLVYHLSSSTEQIALCFRRLRNLLITARYASLVPSFIMLSLITFTPEQRFPDSWMFPDSSHSGYSDSQGVYTTGEFGFVGIQIQCLHFKFRIQTFPYSWRNRKVLIQDSCFVCKRQNES